MRILLLSFLTLLLLSGELFAQNNSSLLFYQPCDEARAKYALGDPDPNYLNSISLLSDAAVGNSAFHLDERPVLSYFAPGNIYSKRGTLSFFWRASTKFSPTEFPIFRVGYADHTSWDMCWLRIDYNGHGFDAFVTDVNLARLRVSTTVNPLPDPSEWTHFAFSWDENTGVKLYLNGDLVAQKDSCVVLNSGLDQFGPHARIISPYQVQSAYSFGRGGDIDEISIFGEALAESDIVSLSKGIIPNSPKHTSDFSDVKTKDEWNHFYGFDSNYGPYLADETTTVRKVQLNEVYDIKRWYWKSNDGIKETTWPGVYNRSSIIGRNDYFQLPDWDCYFASGKSVRFIVPEDEKWNCVEVNGGAWGSIGVTSDKDGYSPQKIATREKGLQHSSHLFPQTRTGQTIVFTNEIKETPISEFDLFYVHEGDAPEGIIRLKYRLTDFNNYQNPTLEEFEDYVKGRHPEDERQMLLALGAGADNSSRSRPGLAFPTETTVTNKAAQATPVEKARMKPLVHILIPSDTRDLDINVPKKLRSQAGSQLDVAFQSRGSVLRPYSWVKMQGGLDGIRIELPPLKVKALHNGLFPMNIQVKDPIWKLRNMIDFSFSVKPGESRVLWLDMRDRILPDDKPLYLTVAGAGDDFDAEMLKDMKIELVFKDREEASKDHIEDRLVQVKDAYAMLCEESASTNRLKKFSQIWGDMNDLLKVDPDNVQGRKYWYIYNQEQVRLGFILPQAPKDVPEWAFYQLKLLGKYREFIEYYIDKRQNEDGEFGGGISDDSDLGNHFAGLIFSGVMTEKATESLLRLLDAVDKVGTLTNGMSTIQTDGLHAYEEGVNIVDQINVILRGDPEQVERMMECALAVKNRLIAENSAGHMHFRSDYFSATKMALEGVWTKSQRREFLHCCPALLLGQMYGNKGARADMLRFADDQLVHGRKNANGIMTVPVELDFITDEPTMFGVDHAAAIYWCAYQWTKDKKYSEVLKGSAYDTRTASNETLVDLYKETLRTIDLYDYIYTEGSTWIDRVYFPSDLLQYTRLGAVAMTRSANFVPSNPVIWNFDSDDSAQKVAILVQTEGRDAMNIRFYNTSGMTQKVRMTGFELDNGRWTFSEGTDTDANQHPDNPKKKVLDFGRGRVTEFDIPAGTEYVVEMKLSGKGLDSSRMCELGIGKKDLSFEGKKLSVIIHNLGGIDVKNVEVALYGADGKLVAKTTTGVLPAPNDFLPKTDCVVLEVPDGFKPEGAKVVIDPSAKLKENYLTNNSVVL